MRIIDLDRAFFHVLGYEYAVGGGSSRFGFLPFFRARTEGWTADLDAIVCTSDLQGRMQPDGGLLGAAVASELVWLSEIGELPPPDRTGIVLAGDFFARESLDRRGGLGDVDSVWDAFGQRFRWTVGVAGNHDSFGGRTDQRDGAIFEPGGPLTLLDGDVSERHGARIGGVSGIIGPTRRPWRREEQDFVETVEHIAATAPDLLVLHDGPNGDVEGQPGSERIRGVLDSSPPTLVVRGHERWKDEIAELSNGTQVLNVDGRVVVLVPDDPAA